MPSKQNMSIQRADKFRARLNYYARLINASTEFLQLVYQKTRFDPKVDPMTYRMERENMLVLLHKFSDLTHSYRDVLIDCSDEVCSGNILVQSSLHFLDSASYYLKKYRNVVPVLDVLKIDFAVEVTSPCIQIVRPCPVEVSQKAQIGNRPKVFVIPRLNILKTQAVDSIPQFSIEEIFYRCEKVSRIFRKETPRFAVSVSHSISGKTIPQKLIAKKFSSVVLRNSETVIKIDDLSFDQNLNRFCDVTKSYSHVTDFGTDLK